jgi:hypothetical protein
METTGKMLLSYTRPGQPVNSRSFTATALGDVRLGPEEVPADDPLTSVTPTVEKSPVMTQPPPQQPPTQVFGQQRRSGCGTLVVALLVLAIITAIVIFLGAFGLLGWIFS